MKDMNFLSALKHAFAGYGIRRACWNGLAVLHTSNGVQHNELYWLSSSVKIGGVSNNSIPVKIMGPSPTYDLTLVDLQARDWETTWG